MTDNVNVTLTIVAGVAATSTGDPSGGSGKILSGVSISPEEARGKEHGKDKACKMKFLLALSAYVSATITNFRYYNNGSNKAEQLGWWSPRRRASPGRTSTIPDATPPTAAGVVDLLSQARSD